MTRKLFTGEEQLIEQLKQNSRKAFEYLYDNYSSALYGIILKVLKDEEKAADTLQDSFLKIWKSIASYDASKGSLFTWMLNIARNSAIDKLRAETKTEVLVSWDRVAEVDMIPVSVVQAPPATIDVRSIVSLMVAEKKEVIEMVYFQGYTHEEVSERLNIPLGTIKSRVRRALTDLRIIFDARQYQPQVA
jgi:RNA polymerase sigma factor (sigma-70 family)